MLTYEQLDVIVWDTDLIGRKVDMSSKVDKARLTENLRIFDLFGIGDNEGCLLELDSFSGLIIGLAIKGIWH